MHVKKLDIKLYCSKIKSNKTIVNSKVNLQNNSEEMDHTNQTTLIFHLMRMKIMW